MPESTKCTLTELTAYYQVSGESGIKRKYPQNNTFLIVPIQGHHSQPVSWTPARQETVRFKTIEKVALEENHFQYKTGQSIVIPLKWPSILGRSQQSDIKFTSTYISNEHSKLQKNADEYQILDLGSSNGTSINGVKIEPHIWHTLKFNDEISLASTEMMFVDLKFLSDLVKMLC